MALLLKKLFGKKLKSEKVTIEEESEPKETEKSATKKSLKEYKKTDLSLYLGKDSLEIRTLLKEKYDTVHYDSDTDTLLCCDANLLMIKGELIPFDEIIDVTISHWKGYYDKYDQLITDADDDDYVVIYDWDYTKEFNNVCVLYEHEGQKLRKVVNIEDYKKWVYELLSIVGNNEENPTN